MFKNKSIGIFMCVMSFIFMVGIIIGSVYALGVQGEAADEIYEYLTDFLGNDSRSGKDVFIASLINNIKLFSVMFIAGFFRFAIPITLGIGCMEGFTSGFTTATLIKLMGWKGLLISLTSIFSVILFVINLIFYGAFSMNYAVFEEKDNKISRKNYIIVSALFFTIFCIASVFDGYITTRFMDAVVIKL